MYIWRFLSFFYGKLTTQLGGGMFYPNHLYSARDLAGKSKEPKVQCTRAPSLFVSTISNEYKRTNYITITTQMQLTLNSPENIFQPFTRYYGRLPCLGVKYKDKIKRSKNLS